MSSSTLPTVYSTATGSDLSDLSITDPFAIFSFIGLVLMFPVLGFLLICIARRSANEEWDRVARSRRYWPIRPSLHRQTYGTEQDLEFQSPAMDAAEQQRRAHLPSKPVPMVIKVTCPPSDSQAPTISPSFDKLYDGCAAGLANSRFGEDNMFLPQTSTEAAPGADEVQSKGKTDRIRNFLGSSCGYQKLSEKSTDEKSCM